VAGAASDPPRRIPCARGRPSAAASLVTGLLLIGVLGLSGPVTAQPDPEGRRYLEMGVEGAIKGNGPAAPYAFLLWTRPNYPSEDYYSRLVIAPTYLEGELVRDRVLGWTGHAFGFGVSGGLFPYAFDDFRDGTYLAGRSFTGSGGGFYLAYYPHLELWDTLPLQGQLRLGATYVGYDKGGSTDSGFQLPQATPLYHARLGVRLGGKPPELLPKVAFGLSAWYEARYRVHADPYGLPGAQDTLEHWTDRAWVRFDLVATVAETHTLSLTATAGTTTQTDKLSTFRMGAALPFRSEFPLNLHGYYSDEVFARRFWLVNAAYRLPILPGSDRVQLQFSADVAGVEYFPGRELPRSTLRGLGVDLTTRLTPRLTLVLGFGYGLDAPRRGGFGGEELGGELEYKF